MSVIKPATNSFMNFLQMDTPTQDQYACFKAETEVDKIFPSLHLIEQLFPNQVLMLCNRSHAHLHYISENCNHVLGYSNKEFLSFSVYDFFKLVHPDDLNSLQQCFTFITQAEPYDPEIHRFILYYRFKHKTGKYLTLHDEKLAVKNENQKYIYFSIFKVLSPDEKFFSVKLDIQQQSKGSQLKVYSYTPRQPENFITPRQHEIITLIIRGFTNQEIADKLHVSVNTVKNHKQLLFNKINVRNSIELASYARGTAP